jgi:hypothetical protein
VCSYHENEGRYEESLKGKTNTKDNRATRKTTAGAALIRDRLLKIPRAIMVRGWAEVLVTLRSEKFPSSPLIGRATGRRERSNEELFRYIRHVCSMCIITARLGHKHVAKRGRERKAWASKVGGVQHSEQVEWKEERIDGYPLLKVVGSGSGFTGLDWNFWRDGIDPLL